ncbi:MAG: hypothetical protein HKN76_05500, partial [Saprospiraceae bacterium]|nr:hypothetical protein [Saprospiraceae bacterium]
MGTITSSSNIDFVYKSISSLGFLMLWSLTLSGQDELKLIAPGATLTKVSSEYKFTEGPAVDRAGNVYFTDQPNDRIIKWSVADGSVSTYMEKTGRSNGLYFD